MTPFNMLPQGLLFILLQIVVTRLLESCQHYVVMKQSNLTHWHPVLGWFAQPMDTRLQDAIGNVKEQLFLLWSQPIVMALLGSALTTVLEPFANVPLEPTPQPSSNIIK